MPELGQARSHTGHAPAGSARPGWAWAQKVAARVLAVLPPAGPRSTRHRVLELSAFLLAASGVSFALLTWRNFFDLRVYWGAVHYWVSGGPIYDFVQPDSTYGFTYTPFAALVMLPLAVIAWPVAVVVSCVAIAALTVTVVRWYIEPVARREGWTPWYAVGVVVAGAIIFDPLRETFLFGQVNVYLLALVGFDLLFLTRRGSRFAGVGIGLATALKLTPGVFLIHLLVTKRWRAALTACSAATGATLAAAALAPDASRVFWTDALWNTDRVGQLDYISNQSLSGAVARMNPDDPSTALWVLAAAAVLVVWAVRLRRVAPGDDKTGFALTGVVACLISPITWVHHLVWLMPALLLLVDRAVDRSTTAPSPRRRAWLWVLLLGSTAVLGSRVVWAFDDVWTNPMVWFLSNAYVWVSLVLLLALPVTVSPVPVTVVPDTIRPAAAPTLEPAGLGDAVPAGTARHLDEAMASLLRDERVAAGDGGVRPPG